MNRAAVAHWIGMWWLIGTDVVAHWIEMWWLDRNVPVCHLKNVYT